MRISDWSSDVCSSDLPAGPGMQIFSPDGKYGYVCSSFNPETDVISVADHQIVARVKQESPFCPNIAATPDGSQVWFTLKDVGKTQVFNARPPFNVLKVLDTGPIRSEEHTSELQSLMRISYAVFCLKKKNKR